MKMKDRIIVPLDTDSASQAIAWVKALLPHVGQFKIGLELIHAMHTNEIKAASLELAVVELAKKRELYDLVQGRLFEDTKLDDIPNTVGGAARAISARDCWMFNVHASAGIDAMMAAVSNKRNSMVFAVTVLTSREENDGHLTFGSASKAKVLQFAREAKLAGVDGIICSPEELKLLKARPELKGLKYALPGIRPAWSKSNDQKRVMTPGEAMMAGADYLVIGRPITGAEDCVKAANKIAEEMEAASTS